MPEAQDPADLLVPRLRGVEDQREEGGCQQTQRSAWRKAEKRGYPQEETMMEETKKRHDRIRGMGRIYEVKGSRNWRIAYNHRGQEYRESCGSPDRKAAEKLLMQRLKERGADEQGLKPFVGPRQDRITINELLDALEADFRRRELKSLKKALGHLRNVRTALGDMRAVGVGVRTINRYIDEERKEGMANGTINRRLGYLSEAFRKAVRGNFMTSCG